MEKEIICTVCPRGCNILVKGDGATVDSVEGYGCKRGISYAEAEYSNPVRILTTTVKIQGKDNDLLPVRSNQPISKAKILECMEVIKKAQVKLPVKMHEVVIENMEFASLIGAIGTKIDVAIAGMTIDEERLQSVSFSDPYYDAIQYVIVPEGSAIATAEDLKNKKIGVQLGTTGDYAVEEIEGATAVQYNKGVDAVNDLLNGRVECVIIDKNPALVFESEYEGIVAIPGDQFDFAVEQYAIAIPKGDAALATKINKALKELKEDGTYNALVEQYIEN